MTVKVKRPEYMRTTKEIEGHVAPYMKQKWYKELQRKKATAAERLRKHKDEGYRYDFVLKHFNIVMKEAGAVVIRTAQFHQLHVPRRIVHHQNHTFYVELKGRGAPDGERCTPEEIAEHAGLKAKGIETYVLGTRIDTFNEIFQYGYTTYPGRHYHKNPEPEAAALEASKRIMESDHVKTGFMY